MSDPFDDITFIVNEQISDVFYQAVEAEMRTLKTQVDLTVQGLFAEMVAGMGKETAPTQIFRVWKDITIEWQIAKDTYGQNVFYQGKFGVLASEYSLRAGTTPYGDPIVNLRGSTGPGFNLDKRNRLRVAKGFAGAGRFASNAGNLEATIVIDAFPNVKNVEHILAPFDKDHRVWAGEFGTKKTKRPARPFLIPMMRYYAEKKIPEVINRVVRS